ncbi:long-chain fatty acid--CoA ligase [Acetatifactor aquisgranensis]|uniref:long-chain fatty acid--CoA ligase n=1 Tax=Acetatifactor aquisgranensis TaxID=2941233 RepID=UPI00203D146D|nr:long-chain fatty acid--CoA ligase [Acetatifactor aquisgranensis]
MSEVYIRSQNKEKLYRLGGNYACIEYGEHEDIKRKIGGSEADKKRHTICISDGCLEEIGEYESKERCIEIIDEIQGVCGQYLYAAGSKGFIRGIEAMPPMAAVVPRVYQMPEK